MIQRIQSLHLSLVLALNVFLIFIPIGNFSGFEFSYMFNSLGLHSQTGNSVFPINTIPMILGLCLMCILTIVTIFLFKNRALQIKLSVFNIMLNLAYAGLMFWYINHIKNLLKIEFALTMKSWALFLPAFSIILLIMTIRAIKKDDNLIKSADRLR